VLVRLDESTYQPFEGKQDLRMGDHPIAWTRCLGNGRSFYTAIGHRPENYKEPHSVTLLENGIAWAAGLGGTQCRDDKEVPAKEVPVKP
jgi:type 1 glutamine amidotransferase